MKFLVTTSPKFQAPPEAVPGLMDALKAWTSSYIESGHLEAVWSVAGKAGGGGILNVGSLEELDAIMAGFPFAPFSEIEIIPIVELNDSIDRVKQAYQARAQAMQKT